MTGLREVRPGVVRLSVRVQARARRDEIVAPQGGGLRVRVTAPPLEGRANQALLHLLAARLHVPQASIKIVSGERSRLKVVEIIGLDPGAILERLGIPPG